MLKRLPWFIAVPLVVVGLAVALYLSGMAAIRSLWFLEERRLERAQVPYRARNKAAGERMLELLRRTARAAESELPYGQFKETADASKAGYSRAFIGRFIPSDHEFYSYVDRAAFNFILAERKWAELGVDTEPSDPTLKAALRPFLDDAVKNLTSAEKEFRAYAR